MQYKGSPLYAVLSIYPSDLVSGKYDLGVSSVANEDFYDFDSCKVLYKLPLCDSKGSSEFCFPLTGIEYSTGLKHIVESVGILLELTEGDVEYLLYKSQY